MRVWIAQSWNFYARKQTDKADEENHLLYLSWYPIILLTNVKHGDFGDRPAIVRAGYFKLHH